MIDMLRGVIRRVAAGQDGSTPSRPRSSECRWCGNEHAASELCRAMRVNRRSFLITASAAAAGAVLPNPFPEPEWVAERFTIQRIDDSDLFTASYAIFLAD